MNNTFANSSPDTTTFVIKNKSKKAIIIFGIKINPGISYDLMQIPGISEHDIRSSIVKGDLNRKLKANQIEIIDVNIDLYTNDDQLGNFLASKGISFIKTSIIEASNAIPTGATVIKPNIAALKALQDAPNGQVAFVETNRGLYKLDTNATNSEYTLNILNSADSNSGVDSGRWIRLAIPDYLSTINPNFYIDPDTGNDENPGDFQDKLKTWDEFYRRTQGELGTDITVILSSASNIWPSTDKFFGSFKSTDKSNLFRLQIIGLPLAAANSTYSTYEPENPLTNQAREVSDTVVPLASYEGKLVAGNGYAGWIVKDLGSNTVRLSTPFTKNPLTLNYVVADLMKITWQMKELSVTNARIEFNQLEFQAFLTISGNTSANNFFEENPSISFSYCKLQSFHCGSGATFYDCLMTTSNLAYDIASNGTYYFAGCYFKNGYVSRKNEKAMFDVCSFETTAAPALTLGANSTLIIRDHCGVFGASHALDRFAKLEFNSSLQFSSASVYGQDILTHLTLGATSKVNLEFTVIYLPGQPLTSTSFIPPLVAGATVPAASSVLLWVDLSLAPFSGYLFDQTNGSQVSIG